MVTMPLIAHPPTRPRPRVLARFRRFVQQLGPYQSLALLGVPAAVLEPLKIVAVGIAGNGHWLAGTATVVAAYAVSLLFIERLFRLVKPKLMMLGWFAAIWSKVVALRNLFLKKRGD
jgi:hypothetical protein